jgi:hypothetical protein
MDSIIEFTFRDKNGKHTMTAVGREEFRDLYDYVTALEQAGIAWDCDYKYIGEDI